jgi:phosphatidylglycerophosphatase A
MFLDKNASLPRSIWTNPIHFVACAFGLGALPWAPGTWATLGAIPLCLALKVLPLWGYALVTVVCILGGIWICGKTNRDFQTADHPACAWDEMSCFLLVMLGIPATWYYLLAGFILFRFLDILKPPPIRWIDRHVHGGIGVMLDDFVAALVTWLILLAFVHL